MGGFSRARTSVVALQRTARAPRATGHDDGERGAQTAATLATAAARAEVSIGGGRARRRPACGGGSGRCEPEPEEVERSSKSSMVMLGASPRP